MSSRFPQRSTVLYRSVGWLLLAFRRMRWNKVVNVLMMKIRPLLFAMAWKAEATVEYRVPEDVGAAAGREEDGREAVAAEIEEELAKEDDDDDDDDEKEEEAEEE